MRLNIHGESGPLVVHGPTDRFPLGSQAFVAESIDDDGYVLDIVATNETIPFHTLRDASTFCVQHGISNSVTDTKVTL